MRRSSLSPTKPSRCSPGSAMMATAQSKDEGNTHGYYRKHCSHPTVSADFHLLEIEDMKDDRGDEVRCTGCSGDARQDDARVRTPGESDESFTVWMSPKLGEEDSPGWHCARSPGSRTASRRVRHGRLDWARLPTNGQPQRPRLAHVGTGHRRASRRVSEDSNHSTRARRTTGAESNGASGPDHEKFAHAPRDRILPASTTPRASPTPLRGRRVVLRRHVIAARGYWSATTTAELAALGFSPAQRRAPALVLPKYSPLVSTAHTRFGLTALSKAGKVAESTAARTSTVGQTPMMVDVHPRTVAILDDPSICS